MRLCPIDEDEGFDMMLARKAKLKEIIAKYINEILYLEKSHRDAARTLGISERALRTYREDMGLKDPPVNTIMRTVSPNQRDLFENMDK